MELLIKHVRNQLLFLLVTSAGLKKPYDVYGIVCGRASPFVYKLPLVHVMKQLGGETLRLCLKMSLVPGQLMIKERLMLKAWPGGPSGEMSTYFLEADTRRSVEWTNKYVL